MRETLNTTMTESGNKLEGHREHGSSPRSVVHSSVICKSEIITAVFPKLLQLCQNMAVPSAVEALPNWKILKYSSTTSMDTHKHFILMYMCTNIQCLSDIHLLLRLQGRDLRLSQIWKKKKTQTSVILKLDIHTQGEIIGSVIHCRNHKNVKLQNMFVFMFP